jgi:lysozyme family protein
MSESENFEQAFNRLLSSEGGYINDPADPGGETNWGISKRSYPDLDIKHLTREDAMAIYKRDFWDVLGEDVHPAIKFQVFDFAVNSGITTAIRKLQSAIGVADDGHFGPVSAARLKAMDVSDVLMRFIAERLDFWRRLSTWPRFGAGWAGRAAADLRYAAQDN